MASSHRKRVRSYNIAGHAHELTFSCFRRLDLLSRNRTCRWFVDAMEAARRDHGLALWAYVIMPEHVHVLLCPLEPKYEMRLIRTALKVPVQRKALRFVRRQAPDYMTHLQDVRPNGKIHYRFWQRGGGYDRNVFEPASVQSGPPLVEKAMDWIWSSGRFYAAQLNVPILMDPLP